MALNFTSKYADGFFGENEITGLIPQIKAAHKAINDKK